MRILPYFVTILFVGLNVYAGVMPEEISNPALEAIITYEDQKIDFSADTTEPKSIINKKIEDFLHFTFVTLIMFI